MKAFKIIDLLKNKIRILLHRHLCGAISENEYFAQLVALLKRRAK